MSLTNNNNNGFPVRRISPMKRCEQELSAKLHELKETGLLKHSLNPVDYDNEFETLEFYGDSVLYERISCFLMQTRRFLNPGLLTRIRNECVCNVNLIRCYDKLGVQNLMTKILDDPAPKAKADVMEAILGELTQFAQRREASVLAERGLAVRDELLSFIAYQGDNAYFRTQLRPQLPRAVPAHTHPIATALSVAPQSPPPSTVLLETTQVQQVQGRAPRSSYMAHTTSVGYSGQGMKRSHTPSPPRRSDEKTEEAAEGNPSVGSPTITVSAPQLPVHLPASVNDKLSSAAPARRATSFQPRTPSTHWQSRYGAVSAPLSNQLTDF